MVTKYRRSKKASITTKSSTYTSIATSYTSAVKLVNTIEHCLNSVWTFLIGLLTALVQPMWLLFLSTPFGSSTSNLEKASQSPPKITPNLDFTPLEPTPSSKKSSQKSRKSTTQLSSHALIASLPIAQRSRKSSTGQTTTSNPKPKKRGQAQANSSQVTGASSAKPKPRAKRAQTSSTK